MGSAIFLLAALAVIAVGSLLLWFRHRKPRTFMSSIDDFQREMSALGDPNSGRPPRRRAGARPPTSRH